MSNGSDINVGSIEEDIEILKNIIEVYESCSVPEIDMQVDITFEKKEVNAIKTILGNLEALCDMQRSSDREIQRQKQINEEHQKINGELREKVKELECENKENKKKYLALLIGQFPDTTETYKKYKKQLQELLQESEDK